ncbi:MAG: hypothetical protein LBT59_25070 [Clostridiales bacterium]|jgi:hypothetical protein|nr:hypothetical protein [Clostridiales bacterium]
MRKALMAAIAAILVASATSCKAESSAPVSSIPTKPPASTSKEPDKAGNNDELADEFDEQDEWADEFDDQDDFVEQDEFFDDEYADGELPYWNGLDFGPYLSYDEKFEIEGDPGEYLDAAQSAMVTFYAAQANGNLPEYSEDTQYLMTLVDLRDIQGEECYIYTLDLDDPEGVLGAAYGYAYQSGRIYMEGYGSEFVLIIDADQGDGDNAFWEGDYLWDGSYRDETSGRKVLNISDFDGTTLEFSFIVNNGDAFEGTASVSENLAQCEGLVFDIAESCEFIIVSTDGSQEMAQFEEVYYRN